jgi:hypothetical protein
MALVQQGVLVGTPRAEIPAQGTSGLGGVSYCVDTPTVMRVCGLPSLSAQYQATSCGAGCAGSELVTVMYRSRANWPPGLSRIFMTLLEGLQPNAEGECAIPEGTTSVSRQGVTWSVETGEGLIGSPQVDAWVARNRRKIRLKDPMHAQLVYTRYYDCAAIEPWTVQPANAFGADFGDAQPQPTLVDPLGRAR